MAVTTHRRSRDTAVIQGVAVSLTLVALTSAAAPALAASSGGCVAARGGSLSAEVAAATSVTRQVSLDAGDILEFSARSSGAASVRLIGGSGAPQTLIGDASTKGASFKAPEAGTYVFAIAAAPSGSASVGVTCVAAATAAANAAFLARRKDLLNAKDPERIRIDRAPTPIANPDKPLASTVAVDEKGNPTQVQFSVSLSEITAAANPGRKPEPGAVDLWLEGRMENYTASAAGSGNLGVLYLGTRTMLGPDILVGGLAQFDRGVESPGLIEPQMAATGWMAGPYMSMKLGSGVVFDGRAAWGETENASAGFELDHGSAERRLVRAKLTGTREVEGWKVAPSLGLVYLEDAVRDRETGETKAEGTGRVEFLPEISRRFAIDGETFVEPRAALGGFVGFDNLGALEPMVMTGRDADLRVKAEAGVAVGVKEGSRLEATGGVESSASTASENWTGRLQLNVPLGK